MSKSNASSWASCVYTIMTYVVQSLGVLYVDVSHHYYTMHFVVEQPVQDAVNDYRLFTADWFDAKEKYCSKITIVLMRRKQAEGCRSSHACVGVGTRNTWCLVWYACVSISVTLTRMFSACSTYGHPSDQHWKMLACTCMCIHWHPSDPISLSFLVERFEESMLKCSTYVRTWILICC